MMPTILRLSIEFTRHAIEKMRARHVSESDIRDALKESRDLFYDMEHETFVATKPLRNRYLVILYTRKNEVLNVVTVYFSTKIDKLITSKIRRGAWIKKG